jgi:hypothetical protein
MKQSVPIKGSLFLAFILFAFSVSAQSLSGGTVAVASLCTSASGLAPDINNVTAATGGTGAYTYQWEAKISVSPWATVIGANGLSISPGNLFGDTYYRRKVTDATGAVSYSNEVLVSVTNGIDGGVIREDGPYIILVNQLPGLISSSTPARFGSGNYSYSWESSNSLSGPWSTIGGEVGLTYQPPVFANAGTYCFRRKAIDNICGTIIYSNSVELTVYITLPFDPTGWTYSIGCVFPGNNQPAKLEGSDAVGGTPPYTYQWEQSTDPTTLGWTIIPLQTGISYQPPVISQTTWYRRKASDAAGASGYSNVDPVTYVTTDADPGKIQPNTSLIAPNAPLNAVLNLVSASNFYGGGYYWQNSTDNTNWSDIAGNNSNTYYPPITTPVYTCYRRGVSDVCVGGTKYFYTSPVCLAPLVPFDGGSISLSGSSCVQLGTSPGAITETAASGGSTPYAYQWEKNDNGTWASIAGATAETYTPGALTLTTSFRRKVADALDSIKYTNEVTVTITVGTLKGGIIDGPIITCSGTTVGIINTIIDACGGSTPLQYVWQLDNGSGWTDISGTNAPTYNAGTIAGDTKFRRKIGDACGSAAYSNEVEVFVYPSIDAGIISPSSQKVCSGTQAPSVIAEMQDCHYTNGTVSYQWQSATSASGPWNNITNAVFPFYLPPTTTQTTYYRLRVSSTVCGAVAYSNISDVTPITCGPGVFGGGRVGSGTGIIIYPNPTGQGQEVAIKIDGGTTLSGTNGTYRVALLGVDGRAYNCSVSSVSTTELRVKLPKPLAAGTYLIQINSGSKQWVSKIITY